MAYPGSEPPPFGERPPNARFLRLRRIPATAVVWSLVAINALVWLATEVAGGSTSTRTLIAFGAKVNPLIASGEYWRLLTACFLHVGLTHLLFNSIGLLSFGRLTEIVFGHARFFAIYALAGITGSVLSYVRSPSVGAGASGAVFGVAGALAVFFWRNRGTQSVAGQGQFWGIVLILAINGVNGLIDPRIDNWAHMGGLIGGVALAMYLTPRVSTITGVDGELAGYRWNPSGLGSWLVVPVMLAIVGAAVLTIPGARFPGR